MHLSASASARREWPRRSRAALRFAKSVASPPPTSIAFENHSTAFAKPPEINSAVPSFLSLAAAAASGGGEEGAAPLGLRRPRGIGFQVRAAMSRTFLPNWTSKIWRWSMATSPRSRLSAAYISSSRGPKRYPTIFSRRISIARSRAVRPLKSPRSTSAPAACTRWTTTKRRPPFTACISGVHPAQSRASASARRASRCFATL
mmetsp:Transcript_25356/g.47332  ORF Transcript_25356/g.47332 Transcript_25356/m.47332 type:complete len:203 (+) Transcript_25356:604-1212(+)